MQYMHYLVLIPQPGERNKGWYYGENVRTGKRGWFPLAYTEQVKDADVDSGYGYFCMFINSTFSSRYANVSKPSQ